MNINKFLLIIFCKRLLQKIKILPKKRSYHDFLKNSNRIELSKINETEEYNIFIRVKIQNVPRWHHCAAYCPTFSNGWMIIKFTNEETHCQRPLRGKISDSRATFVEEDSLVRRTIIQE